MRSSNKFATVEWTAKDVKTLKGCSRMTTAEAEAFLAQYEDRLSERLIELGWDVMDMLMQEHKRGQ